MMRKPLVKMNERQALERMSSRCAKSEQCEADVRRKLAEWEQDDAAADRIVERLRAEGFVDDERFCRAFVEDKWRFNRWGRTKIRMALRMKGMDGAPADEALAAVDDNDNLMGYAFCIFKEVKNDNILTDTKSLYIDDLCVDERFRGQGIGKALYQAVKKFAADSGCYNLTLNVWSCNTSALEFYKRCGFTPQKTIMEQILRD